MQNNKLEFKLSEEKTAYIYKELKKNRENSKYPENFDFEKALTEIINKQINKFKVRTYKVTTKFKITI